MLSLLLATTVAVADLGFGSCTNEFGAMSDPAVFERALKGAFEVRRISGERLGDPAVLSPETVDVLVVPCGSAWPVDAATNLQAYVKGGGSLFTCGGLAFDKPVIKRDGRWRSVAELKNAPRNEGTVDCPLPEPAAWSVAGEEGLPCVVGLASMPNGRAGLRFRYPHMLKWNIASVPFDGARATSDGVISFWAKGDAATDFFWFELHEKGGYRSRARVRLTTDWRNVRLTPNDFMRRGPQLPMQLPGVGVDFTKTTSLSIGVSAEILGAGKAYVVELGDVRVGADAAATDRRLPLPWINTRYGKVGDCITPHPDQIGAFDPSFELLGAERLSTSLEAMRDMPSVSLTGPIRGYAAIAQLGVNGHGFYDNRATWRPLLETYDAAGKPCGPAGGFVRHVRDAFKGSSWAIFGVDNRDLFAADGEGIRLLVPLMRKLTEKTFLSHTMPHLPCFRRGEMASIEARVTNCEKEAKSGTVVFRLMTTGGRTIDTQEAAWALAPGAAQVVSVEWKVPQNAPDFVRFTAELRVGRVRIERETNAFVVWTPELVAKGPRFSTKGSLLTLNGETRFLSGAQTFWGQKESYTASSPLAFDRDFRQMASCGLCWTRCFFPWRSEWDRRFSDMVVQLAQKHGIALYHCQQYADVMVEGAELSALAARFAEIATRYRDVPGLAIDLRNEPTMGMPPSRTAEERFARWVRTCTEAIHAVAPERKVSMGWSQGWAGGKSSKDPLLTSAPLDFTDRHYYGPPEFMAQNLKDVDLRAYGLPLVLGECGSKDHPTYFERDVVNGDTPASYARKFRYLASHAFGLGAGGILAWCWRDPVEGLFPCGLVHGTGVMRPAARDFVALAKAFGAVKVVENPPDVLLVLQEKPRMEATYERTAYIERAWAVDRALLWWGANWGKASESRVQDVSVRLQLKPEDLPTEEAALRQSVGDKLREAGCALARQAGDPESVDVMCVKGDEETAWVFWNGGTAEATVSRAGMTLRVQPDRVGLMRVSDADEVIVSKEF